ncbi:hypothetical protein MTsPCn9_16260 [Croceitalea sp. MTPC9]|nr:hypothetical protein MTsPCn6_09110 [Croceitalea sp. MTPC6]GMN16690.1 hypothetical protein MTsPCn9_16260 [Croceitalea sp. MTPC9]
MLILPFFICLFLFQISCSTENDVDEESPTEDSTNSDEDTNSEDSNSGENSGTIELTASPDILTNDGEGSQSWNDDVTLTAKKIDGSNGRVVYENRFTDDGFGVAGGRWEQIDYYYEYQGEIVKASEQLIINFSSPVNNVTIQVGQMDPREGRQAKEGTSCEDNDTTRVDESGKWTAFNADREEIGSGILLDEYSIEGKLPDSMGSYRFKLETKNISTIVIEATQWGGEERGCPTYRSSYANQSLNDSGNTENNSEFNLMALSYQKN